MIMRKIYYLVFYIFIFSFVSCSSGFYTPANEVVNSTYEKGQLEFSANIIQTGTTHLQTSLAYSPMNNVGFSFSNYASRTIRQNTIAVGLYSNPRKETNLTFFDVYAGYAAGVNTNYYLDFETSSFFSTPVKFVSNYQKFFLQSGYHINKSNLSFDVNGRFSFVDFKKIDAFGAKSSYYILDVLTASDPYLFLELSPKISFGQPHYRINFGFNFNLGGNGNTGIDAFSFYAGISTRLDKLWPKLKEK